MPENDPGRAPPSADRGTQLGAGTGVLTLILTVVLQLMVGLRRILRVVLDLVFLPLVVMARVAVPISGLLSAVATYPKRIAPGLLRPIRAILDSLGAALRWLGLPLYRRGASLIARARRSSIVRAVVHSPRIALVIRIGFGLLAVLLFASLTVLSGARLTTTVVVAAVVLINFLARLLGAPARAFFEALTRVLQRLLAAAVRWFDLALHHGGARLIARVRHAAIVRVVLALSSWLIARGRRFGARLAAGVRWAVLGLVLACGQLAVRLRRGGSWLIARARRSSIVRAVVHRPRIALVIFLISPFAAASVANTQVAHTLLGVLLFIVLPLFLLVLLAVILLSAFRYLLGALEGPLEALGRRIAERMVAARQRAAHSLHVASSKAMRSLHAPITAPVGAAPSGPPPD